MSTHPHALGPSTDEGAAVSSELKACEHCRGVAKYETDLRNARVMFYVRCDACGVGTMGYKTGPEAAAAWNRRTPSPAVLALVEACQGLVPTLRSGDWGNQDETADEIDKALAAVEKEIQ
jgi:hypothetical protein